MSRLRLLGLAALVLALAVPAFAQGTNGVIEGQVKDEQGLALPGASVTARNTETGFTRSTTSDEAGDFRIPGVPVGTYEVKVEMAGFAPQARKVEVNVATTTTAVIRMAVAGKQEELTVTAEAPLIDARDPGVGEVVTSAQIENLPLNGRQFGNLAALVPGVSLGYHTDPTKSTQFAPQVGGGGGRNINYLIDGGDNNDDTVGGLVQNFPLDSIGEFAFETQRFRVDTGRANGGTIKVVTKSGTNDLRGSAFNYFRDKSLNSITETEKNGSGEKGDYRRWQYGASLGGPIRRDKTHFFVSFERIQQDTTQNVSTAPEPGAAPLFPDKDGVYGLPYRENMLVAKVTNQFNANNYLSVRYGYNDNSQVYGASPQSPPESWGDSVNKFHSANVNLNSVLSAGRLNEFTFQFSYFKNHIGENSTLPAETFPSGVFVGQSVNTPQTTEQHKFQFRDDFTWNMGRHEWKVGASFIYEPVLDITFSSGREPLYTHLSDSRDSAISNITYNGSIGGEGGGNVGSIPNNQYAFYLQDTWRATEKLTLDLGIRYDLVTGFAFDQDNNIIFAELQEAGRQGVFQRSGLPCPCVGFEDFGKEPAEDKNNVAPRVGFTYDVNAKGDFVIRGGAGRYYDYAYTNANILFAVIGAQSSFGKVYEVNDTGGIKNADGSLFHVGQPLPANQITNATRPLPSHAATPRPKQPYTDQVNLGFSKALGGGFAFEMDGVYSKGNDFGTRIAANVRVTPAGSTSLGPRRFLGILPRSGGASWRVDVMEGESSYKGVNLAVKKRWDGHLQAMVSYTLSESKSNASLRATDEFGEFNSLDAFNPFQDAQFAPTRTDARHRINVSGTWSPGWDLNISPVFRFRSKTPYNIVAGQDLNRDGTNFDLPPGVTSLNSGRGADFKQLDLRVSKKFRLDSHRSVELLVEGFNVLNAKNPAGFNGNMRASNFGQPTEFAGDFQRGEQRLFQLGARVAF